MRRGISLWRRYWIEPPDLKCSEIFVCLSDIYHAFILLGEKHLRGYEMRPLCIYTEGFLFSFLKSTFFFFLAVSEAYRSSWARGIESMPQQ